MIRMEQESIVFRPVREGFPSEYAFSGSIFAFFGVSDIAERPEVYYQRGQEGRFSAKGGNSPCLEKVNFYILHDHRRKVPL